MVPEALPLEMVRELVPGLPIETLAQAVAGPSVFDCFADETYGRFYFRCPSCRPEGHNRACARVVDAIRWHCDRCRSGGTRWLLERLVVEYPDALERLAEILAEQEAA